MSKPMKIMLGVVVILLIVFPLFSNAYTVQVAITTITYSMLGLAFAFSMRVGLPRMDVAAWWGVGGYTTALLMVKDGMNFWLTALIGGIIAVIVGALVFSIAIPTRHDGILYLLHGFIYGILSDVWHGITLRWLVGYRERTRANHRLFRVYRQTRYVLSGAFLSGIERGGLLSSL